MRNNQKGFGAVEVIISLVVVVIIGAVGFVFVDKIISNHLNRKLISNEAELIKEEDKDSEEINKILKIIKAVKDTTTK